MLLFNYFKIKKMQKVVENVGNELLNYEIRIPATEERKEAVLKISGSDYGIKVKAEHQFIGAVFAGFKPELWFNDERIDFDTKDAYMREHEAIVKATGMFYTPEKWNRRFIRLIDWRATGVEEEYQVGKFKPEEIRIQEIAVLLSEVLHLTPEQIAEHLSFAKVGIDINVRALGIEGNEELINTVDNVLAEYWYNEGYEDTDSVED